MKYLKEIEENKIVLLLVNPETAPLRVKVLEKIQGYDENVFVIKVNLNGNITSPKGMSSATWMDGRTPVLKEYGDIPSK